MHTLTEAYQTIGSDKYHEIWNGKIACSIIDGERTLRANRLNDSIGCFTFTLVRRGHIILENNGQRTSFAPNDIYAYMPGFSVRIISVSPDYESIALLIDENSAYQSVAFHNIVRISSLHIALTGKPKITLSDENAQMLDNLLQLIRKNIIQPSNLTEELLQMYSSAFMMELTILHDFVATNKKTSDRKEDIFVAFYTLLRQNYINHHDIGFYANKLNISTTYLSRIVREITHSTVITMIDQALLMEAVHYLTYPEQTVSNIAYVLGYSSPAAFTRFFKRMTGKNPSEYKSS